MQTSLDLDILKKVLFLSGSAELVSCISDTPALVPFNDSILDFLNDVSKAIMSDSRSKAYSDVITFAFWIRKASMIRLREKHDLKDGYCHLGKGVAFHIAPSNVPVNFAYSLVSGLICGNINVVRVPSKDFPQVGIIVDAINSVLNNSELFRKYVFLVRYDREKDVNDLFSSMADVRIIWGGDNTIAEIRKSPLPPRSGEVTFADRYSLAVIDSESYLAIEDKLRVASDFYNDTFFSDQNACTSPRIIIWTGSEIDKAKKEFWEYEHALVQKKYQFQPIQGVNKLTSSMLLSAIEEGCIIEPLDDNLIVRVQVPEIKDSLMDYKDNSGFFLEYDCQDIMEIRNLCNNKRCQTLAYIGDPKMILPLIDLGIKGIDRVVPMGKTMDYDLIWDGYCLPSMMTRIISIQ